MALQNIITEGFNMVFVVYGCCSTSFQSVFFHFQKFILEENSGNGTGINFIRIDLSKT